jgi:hypothetical protein
MATQTDVRSVAASAVVANVLSGKTFEFVNEPSIIRAGIIASAVGMFATIIVGAETVLEDQEISAANRMPVDPDDFAFEAGGIPGDRIVIKLRNSTAAAITVNTMVKVEPA